ncbi:hypothetical protein NDU88_007317 [Pleurodeles waltl]|uniref:Uncharacterized protein n=1 Tax=Pleurodeles waltl TaxID=8319 RepID=A0AAV7TZH3_PLEWA|nr:hypothetical protein NDU88_007317 [Pleurodeles waltl]
MDRSWPSIRPGCDPHTSCAAGERAGFYAPPGAWAIVSGTSLGTRNAEEVSSEPPVPFKVSRAAGENAGFYVPPGAWANVSGTSLATRNAGEASSQPPVSFKVSCAAGEHAGFYAHPGTWANVSSTSLAVTNAREAKSQPQSRSRCPTLRVSVLDFLHLLMLWQTSAARPWLRGIPSLVQGVPRCE